MEIEILGCKGKISDIEKVVEITSQYGKSRGIALQLMDPDVVYGKDHILSAVLHALRSFKEKRNTSTSLPMEILLYASGKIQVKEAIDFMGIKKDGGGAIIVCVGGTDITGATGTIPQDIEKLVTKLGLRRDDSILEGTKDVLQKFGITQNEIETADKSMYQDLILERIAMVDVLK